MHTPTLLLALHLLTLTKSQTLTTPCSAFNLTRRIGFYNPDTDDYIKPSFRTYQISADVLCPSNSTCPIPIGGFVTDARTLSIATSDSAAAQIWDLIYRQMNDTFPALDEDASSRVQMTMFDVDAAATGHVAFTPTHRCVNGTLYGCAQQPEFNGVVLVEACEPIALHPDAEELVLEGSTAFVVTDVTESEAGRCNPANTTRASEAPDYDCVHQANGTMGSSDQPSSAVRGVPVGVAWMVGVLGVMFAVL